MSSQQKRGFRLPWGGERGPEAGAGAATLDAPPPHAGTPRHDGDDDFGAGPFQLDASAPAPDVSTPNDPALEDAMIDTQAPTAEASQADQSNGGPAPAPAWPADDTATSPTHAGDRPAVVARPPIRAEGPRRDNPLVAGLIKAMREAAIASREETSARLQAEATTRMTSIRERGTTDASALRKRADEDIAGIREWAKAEIARVRQAADDKVEARKAELEAETERHSAAVARLVDDVETVVLTFETDMDTFFGRLLAETDPARLAALAEQAPDSPDLSGDGPTALDYMDATPATDAPATHEWSDVSFSGETAAGLEASVAAEAEAAATEGLDLSTSGEWPTAVLAAARRNESVGDGADDGSLPEGSQGTRLMVSGLTSVAGISSFKGALGSLPGVHSVSVSSGDPGVFVFEVAHASDIDLGEGLTSLAGFAPRITDATAEGLTVVAQEPAE